MISIEAIFSKLDLSLSSKRPKSGLSISRTPMDYLFLKSGITISDRESESQVICPEKTCVLSTIKLLFSFMEVPQTPFPSGIEIHAGLPWKGPRISVAPSTK